MLVVYLKLDLAYAHSGHVGGRTVAEDLLAAAVVENATRAGVALRHF